MISKLIHMIYHMCILKGTERKMLQPVQLFKILSDETRLAIVMLLRESGELCLRYLCSHRRITAQNIATYGYPARGKACS
jgi:DNA-binding transcriptional ArsR family regulator